MWLRKKRPLKTINESRIVLLLISQNASLLYFSVNVKPSLGINIQHHVYEHYTVTKGRICLCFCLHRFISIYMFPILRIHFQRGEGNYFIRAKYTTRSIICRNTKRSSRTATLHGTVPRTYRSRERYLQAGGEGHRKSCTGSHVVKVHLFTETF